MNNLQLLGKKILIADFDKNQGLQMITDFDSKKHRTYSQYVIDGGFELCEAEIMGETNTTLPAGFGKEVWTFFLVRVCYNNRSRNILQSEIIKWL